MKKVLLAMLATMVVVSLPSLSWGGTLYTASLDQSQEVPPTGSLATGTSLLYLNFAQTSIHIKLTVNNFTNTITASHIHRGAVGVNGPVVFSIGAFTPPTIEVDWNNPTAADLADLNAGNFYVNVHSNVFGGGEIRGQIGKPASLSFAANIDQSQEVPPTGSPGTGFGDITVDGSLTHMHLELSAQNLTSAITASHIHKAPPGQNGGVVFNIGPFVGSTRADFNLSAGQAADLLNGQYYINIHTTNFPNGEIRGQIANNSPASVGDGIIETALPAISGFPNPMTDGAIVRYRIGQSTPGEVGVYNVAGRRIRMLRNGVLAAGENSVAWDGRDDSGFIVPSGTYYYMIKTEEYRESGKAIVVH